MTTYPALREQMSIAFNKEEIILLCGDLGLDADNVPGGDRSESYFIEQMILYCERRGRMDDLLAALHRTRPNIDWPNIAAQASSPDQNWADLKSAITQLKTQFVALIDAIQQSSSRLHKGVQRIDDYSQAHIRFQQADLLRSTASLLISANVANGAALLDWETLGMVIEALPQAMKDLALEGQQAEWGRDIWAQLSQLERLSDRLQTALNNKDVTQLQSAAHRASLVLGDCLKTIDAGIYNSKTVLEDMNAAGESLGRVAERLDGFRLADSARGQLQQVRQHRDTLLSSKTKLGNLVDLHKHWQDLDVNMRVIETNLDDALLISEHWSDSLRPALHSLIALLAPAAHANDTAAAEVAQHLRQLQQKLDDIFGSGADNHLTKANLAQVMTQFRNTRRFFGRTGTQLAQTCKTLRPPNDPLSSAIQWLM